MLRSSLVLLILSGSLLAADATPREQVLCLVPPDSAVCFVVQNLRDQSQAVANSPFAAWASAKFGAKVKGNVDAQQIQQIEEFVTKMLGVSLPELRDDILGDCVAFAYQPGPPGQPNQERGVVILHAAKPEKLQKLIDTLNKLQKQTGELTGVEELNHRGKSYFKRLRGENPPEFYFAHDHLFAFAVQESALQAIIDREASPGDSPILKTLDDLKLKDAFLSCWLNPRKLDADLEPPATASAAEKAGRAQMAKLWKAVDQCAFYLDASKDLELGLAMTYRTADLPAELKSQFGVAPSKSAIWSVIPDDALFAVAADIELNALLNVMASFLPESERPALRQQIEKAIAPLVGPEKLKAIIDGIGPEVGVWAVKSPKDRGPLPTVMIASRVNKEADTVLRTLNFYTQMLLLNYNQNHDDQIALTEDKEGSVNLHTLSNDKLFPPNVRPTYSMIANYLVVGSEPECVKSFKAPVAAPVTADVPLARIAGTSLRGQISEHRDGLAAYLASQQAREASAIRGDLDNVASVLEAFEKVELLVRGDSRSRTFALKVQMVKSLK